MPRWGLVRSMWPEKLASSFRYFVVVVYEWCYGGPAITGTRYCSTISLVLYLDQKTAFFSYTKRVLPSFSTLVLDVSRSRFKSPLSKLVSTQNRGHLKPKAQIRCTLIAFFTAFVGSKLWRPFRQRLRSKRGDENHSTRKHAVFVYFYDWVGLQFHTVS